MRAEQNETVKKRMEELAGEKKRLGAELVTIDGQIELLGEYVRACCSAMEEQINRHFRSIRWKLFDTAKNGSVQDLCTATVNGVPYGGGLNTGRQHQCRYRDHPRLERCIRHFGALLCG